MYTKEEVENLIGTKVTVSGHVFSYNKSIEELEYDCLNVRFKTKSIFNEKTLNLQECIVFEALLKREGMKKAQWTKPMFMSLFVTT